MAVINTQARTGSGNGTMQLLESDVYYMTIKRAVIEEDQFADPRKDGSRPEKLVLTWEVSRVTDEQDDACIGLAVWQRINPYYGTIREGGPSNFKAFIDGLRDQGLLPDFDPVSFDTDSLIGIEQRVSVEKYAKTMGANTGQPGNRVKQIMPITRRKNAPKPPPAPKNTPQPIDAEEIDESQIPF